MSRLVLLASVELLSAACFVWLGLRAALRLHRQRKEFFNLVQGLTLERMVSNDPPRAVDRKLNGALGNLWMSAHGWARRAHELGFQIMFWQQRYGQARAVIEILGEFNQVMPMNAILGRLSHRLSAFFGNDTVGIWLRGGQNNFELIAFAEGSLPSSLHATDPLVRQIMSGVPAPVSVAWMENRPWMAYPLLDAFGQNIGLVAVTSRRRAVYTGEDRGYLALILAHIAMVIQPRSADRRTPVGATAGFPDGAEAAPQPEAGWPVQVH
jgi:hypothetical protein